MLQAEALIYSIREGRDEVVPVHSRNWILDRYSIVNNVAGGNAGQLRDAINIQYSTMLQAEALVHSIKQLDTGSILNSFVGIRVYLFFAYEELTRGFRKNYRALNDFIT